MNDHKKAKHAGDEIPCDICEYVANSIYDYDRHAKTKHADRYEGSKSNKPTSKKEVRNTSGKSNKEAGVKIPCDLCAFTSVSADDFIKHIENKHQQNAKEITKNQYTCGKCDFRASDEVSFKKHLESAHKMNVGGWQTINRSSGKSNKLCLYWNQGHCRYNLECRFEHKEIEACVFKERCSRTDCRFWHEASSGKYPFLDRRHLKQVQNQQPRTTFPFPRRN